MTWTASVPLLPSPTTPATRATRAINSWLGISLLVLTAALIAPSSPAYATEEVAKAEGGMVCTACHDKPGSKRLTDRGKYFELMRSFDGYEEIRSTFGQCTSCHVRKPGSKRLTPVGRRFRALMFDMKSLRDWLEATHPKAPENRADQQDSMESGDAESKGGPAPAPTTPMPPTDPENPTDSKAPKAPKALHQEDNKPPINPR